MIAEAEKKQPISLSEKRGVPVRRARARFDSAATTNDNRRHWANADSLSADQAASVDVRRTLRTRARYEVANNSYARGIVLTLANDAIGTGPRLQLLTENDSVNREIEREFELWAREVSLAGRQAACGVSKLDGGRYYGAWMARWRNRASVIWEMLVKEEDL